MISGDSQVDDLLLFTSIQDATGASEDGRRFEMSVGMHQELLRGSNHKRTGVFGHRNRHHHYCSVLVYLFRDEFEW